MSEAVETKPLTDEELDGIERRVYVDIPPTTRDLLEYASAARAAVPRLLAEIRRLRSEGKSLRLRLSDMYENWFPDNGKVDQALKDVERLRSDEWLEKAAKEIEAEDCVTDEAQDPEMVREVIVTILRKHRDGPSS